MATGYEKAFALTTLTAVINNLPFKPYRLGQLGWFEEQGIAQTTARIEQLNGSIGLVSTAPRGGPGQVILADKRKELTFAIPHVPALAGLDADELQDVRAFGSESSPDSVTSARDRLLTKLRSNLELTLEAHRLGALKGLILDKDGSTLQNLFTAFGVTQQTQVMALGVDATKVKTKVADAIIKLETELGGTPYSGLRALCGTAFFNALTVHPNVEKYWLNTPVAPGLVGSSPLQAIEFAGVIWERLRGISGCAIADDEAYLVPEGVPGLLITRYAPANYIETVNTLGLPLYAKAEPRGMSKGYDIEAQTNPLNLCTRPSAIVKLTVA